MSGNLSPKRGSLGPISGFVPKKLIWSYIIIRLPGVKNLFNPPAAFVKISFLISRILNTLMGNVLSVI